MLLYSPAKDTSRVLALRHTQGPLIRQRVRSASFPGTCFHYCSSVLSLISKGDTISGITTVMEWEEIVCPSQKEAHLEVGL